VGNFLSLRIREGLLPGQKHRTVKAEVVKLFLPFTMSLVLVVRVHYPALGLKKECILKICHRRFTCQHRNGNRDAYWTPEREQKYHQYVLNRRTASDFFQRLDDPEYPKTEQGRDSKEWSEAQYEAYFQHFSVKAYNSEAEVYRRMKDLQGIDIP
jgi:hypothetical protein